MLYHNSVTIIYFHCGSSSSIENHGGPFLTEDLFELGKNNKLTNKHSLWTLRISTILLERVLKPLADKFVPQNKNYM